MHPLTSTHVKSPTGWIGELIASDGSRRPLPGPCALLGSDPSCELCYDHPDFAPFHAVFAFTPQGITLRDLHSPVGTQVNRQSIGSLLLKDGDVLEIGAVSLRLSISVVDASAEEITAALACRQVMLVQEEDHLLNQQDDLRKQEERIAILTEEKTKRLLLLTERYQEQRRQLKQERKQIEGQIDEMMRDLPKVKKDVVAQQRQLLAEAKRLKDLEAALKVRFQRRWQAEHRKIRHAQRKLLEAKKALELRESGLAQAEQTLKAKRLRFNTDFVMGRQHLRESWGKLKSQRQRWKHRRGRERAVLKVREHDLEAFARRLKDALDRHHAERAAETQKHAALQEEVAALDRRATHQQQLLESRQEQLRTLDVLIEQRRRELEAAGQTLPASPAVFESLPAELLVKSAKLAWLAPAQDALPVESHTADASELVDQRRVILELWHRMESVLQTVEAERQQHLDEMDALARAILEAGSDVKHDLVLFQDYEGRLARERDDVVREQQHVVGWNARLQLREANWQGEQHQLRTALRVKEERLQQGLTQLEEMRRAWSERWQKEFDELHEERAQVVALMQEWTAKRAELLDRMKEIEEKQRHLGEQEIALEAYRVEQSIGQNPEANKRLDVLRRRWLLQNANILRTITRDRNGLREDLVHLRDQISEWEQRADDIQKSVRDLDERAFQYDHQVTQNIDQQSRLREEAESAEALHAYSSRQIEVLKAEFETLAHALLDAPEGPTSLPRAA